MKITIMIAVLTALVTGTAPAQNFSESTRHSVSLGNSTVGARTVLGARAALGRRPGDSVCSRKTADGRDAFETNVEAYAATDLRLLGSELRVLNAYAGARAYEAHTFRLRVLWFDIVAEMPQHAEAFAVARFAGRTIINERHPSSVDCDRTLGNYNVFNKSKTVMAGPVPVLLSARGYCSADMDVAAKLPRFDRAQVDGTISGGPALSISGGVGGGAPGIGASAGIAFTGEFGRLGATANVLATTSGVSGFVDIWQRSFRLLLEAYVRVDYWFDSWEERVTLLSDSGPTENLGRFYLR